MKSVDELQCVLNTVGDDMGIMVIDTIFNKYAFHRGDQDKPFAMLRNTFREAVREVELATQYSMLIKFKAIQLEIYQELEKELNWVFDSPDDEIKDKRELVFAEMIQDKLKEFSK